MNKASLNRQFLQAAEQGAFKLMKQLLTQGADIDSQNDNKWSALQLLAFNDHSEQIPYFVEQGADIHIRNILGKTVLNYAVDGGYLDSIRYLVGKGARLNDTDANGFTPFHNAAGWGVLSTVQCLIECGADVLAESDDGRSAYDLAEESNVYEVIDYIKSLMLAKKENNCLDTLIEHNDNEKNLGLVF